MQENVLEEATRMIPDTRQRLEGALQDLSNFMVSLSMLQNPVKLCVNIKKLHKSLRSSCSAIPVNSARSAACIQLHERCNFLAKQWAQD